MEKGYKSVYRSCYKKEGIKEMANAKKFWIQEAIKPSAKGSLRRGLKVKKGKNIPAAKLARAAKKKGKLGKRARLAITLKKLAKGKKKR